MKKETILILAGVALLLWWFGKSASAGSTGTSALLASIASAPNTSAPAGSILPSQTDTTTTDINDFGLLGAF